MLSKQSLKFFKSNIALFKGKSSQGVRMKQNLPSRSTGRLSRLDFGPKPAHASSCSNRNSRAGEQYRLATYPRGYQLEKKRAKAARIYKLLFPAPAPQIPQTSDSFGSPNIYRAPGLRGGDSKYACACFRPTERTTSWGLADHIRRHEAQTAGIPFQWPPVMQEALPTVPFESLCQYCRGGHQEAQIIINDVTMSDAPEELWDVEMYDAVIDVPMEDAPPLSTFPTHSFPTYLGDRSVDMSDAPASLSAIPWYTPCLQGTFDSQPRPSLQQASELGHFTAYGGRPVNPWVKKGLQAPAFQEFQDMGTLHQKVNGIQNARPSQFVGASQSHPLYPSRFAPARKSTSANKFELVYEDNDDDLSGDEGLDLRPPPFLR